MFTAMCNKSNTVAVWTKLQMHTGWCLKNVVVKFVIEIFLNIKKPGKRIMK